MILQNAESLERIIDALQSEIGPLDLFVAQQLGGRSLQDDPGRFP